MLTENAAPTSVERKQTDELGMAGQFSSLVAWSIPLLVLFGCYETRIIQGYDGPARSDDQVAVVQGEIPGPWVLRIVDDASKVAVYDYDLQPSWNSWTTPEPIVKLAPGTYRIAYRMVDCGSAAGGFGCGYPRYAAREALVTMQAGHTYSTHGHRTALFSSPIAQSHYRSGLAMTLQARSSTGSRNELHATASATLQGAPSSSEVRTPPTARWLLDRRADG